MKFLEKIFDNSKKSSVYNNKVVAIGGFCWSGSGAVVDFLSEFDNIKIFANQNIAAANSVDINKTKGNEFKFFIDKYSIFNLEKTFNKSGIEQDIAIKQFISFLYEKINFSASNEIFNENFYKISVNFLENIIDLDEYTKDYMKDREYPYTLYGKNIEDYKNCSFVYDGFVFYKFKKMNKRDFDIQISNYIYDFFNNIDSDKILVFDQMFSYGTMLNKMNGFINENPVKEICVYRDPRDQYFSWYKETPKPDILKTPDKFIEFYKKNVLSKINSKSKQRLCIKFEELVFNYEKTTQQIIKFLELNSENWISKKAIFNPDISKKNIGAWKNFINQDVMKQIGKELRKYCYNN